MTKRQAMRSAWKAAGVCRSWNSGWERVRVSKPSIGTNHRHGRTLEGRALATLTLTEEKDFDGLLLPPLVALGLEHLVNVIVDFLRLLFGPESLFAVCDRLVRGWQEGGAEGVRERAASGCGTHARNERWRDGLEEHRPGDGRKGRRGR